MIPAQNLVAWGNVVPWTDPRQVEQDLIISRALVVVFSNQVLRGALRVRGGTALSKLHFPAPMRYSEDIDLVRTSAGPIGPILDQLREVLEPWLGRVRFDQSPVAPKLRFRVEAEDGSGVPIRLKIEINTREIEAYDAPLALPLKVANPWFSGAAEIPTFSREEMMATKLRAAPSAARGPKRGGDRVRRSATLFHDGVEGTAPVLVRVVHHDVDEDGGDYVGKCRSALTQGAASAGGWGTYERSGRG